MQKRFVIYGLVQGVGFRPYVAELAGRLGLSGNVRNAGGIVIVNVSGERAAVEELYQSLSRLDQNSTTLPGARVDRIEVASVAVDDFPEDGFHIIPSDGFFEKDRFLPPDIATCPQCQKELLDTANRRYRYPFLSCVSCGPRFTIMKSIPYDREHTTMADFPLCKECERDYEELGNRRRYAQTIACDTCGPRLMAYASTDESQGDGRIAEGAEALETAEMVLRRGGLVAIKDIGGYHIAFDPYHSGAAVRLRRLKHRERKPFAILFPDLASIENVCQVNEKEKELLESDARPIVLLRRKVFDASGAAEGVRTFAPEVCGTSNRIGAMLPCNPLQILLTQDMGPLVMTSANYGGEPMITSDEKIKKMLEPSSLTKEKGIDLVLANDREILIGLDDSIYQVTKGHTQVIRRARGLVPTPIFLEKEFLGEVFAAGGDLKSVFAFGRNRLAYLSGHYGDLEEHAAYQAREKGIAHFRELFGFSPGRFVCDEHPAYRSFSHTVQMVKEAGDAETSSKKSLARVQHHHAHIASVMAEHGLSGKVLGVAFDGTGYREDGTVWGGEFLLCEGTGMKRIGHLAAVPMMGGDAAAKNANLPALCYIYEAIKRGYLTPEGEDTSGCAFPEDGGIFGWKADPKDAGLVFSALEHHVNVTASSSAGRLFDAVCALLGFCSENSYEGECPAILQTKAEQFQEECPDGAKMIQDDDGKLRLFAFEESEQIILDTPRLIADLLMRKSGGVATSRLAYEFHKALADGMMEVIHRWKKQPGMEGVPAAFSGGTFYNQLLLGELLQRCEDEGIPAYINEQVPCGDGGLALGQLYLQ